MGSCCCIDIAPGPVYYNLTCLDAATGEWRWVSGDRFRRAAVAVEAGENVTALMPANGLPMVRKILNGTGNSIEFTPLKSLGNVSFTPRLTRRANSSNRTFLAPQSGSYIIMHEDGVTSVYDFTEAATAIGWAHSGRAYSIVGNTLASAASIHSHPGHAVEASGLSVLSYRQVRVSSGLRVLDNYIYDHDWNITGTVPNFQPPTAAIGSYVVARRSNADASLYVYTASGAMHANLGSKFFGIVSEGEDYFLTTSPSSPQTVFIYSSSFSLHSSFTTGLEYSGSADLPVQWDATFFDGDIFLHGRELGQTHMERRSLSGTLKWRTKLPNNPGNIRHWNGSLLMSFGPYTYSQLNAYPEMQSVTVT